MGGALRCSSIGAAEVGHTTFRSRNHERTPEPREDLLERQVLEGEAIVTVPPFGGSQARRTVSVEESVGEDLEEPRACPMDGDGAEASREDQAILKQILPAACKGKWRIFMEIGGISVFVLCFH